MDQIVECVMVFQIFHLNISYVSIFVGCIDINYIVLVSRSQPDDISDVVNALQLLNQVNNHHGNNNHSFISESHDDSSIQDAEESRILDEVFFLSQLYTLVFYVNQCAKHQDRLVFKVCLISSLSIIGCVLLYI